MTLDPAPDILHDLFWNTEVSPLQPTAVEWRLRLESKVGTAMRMSGMDPIAARKEAFRGLVIDYLNETFPRNCDPNRCEHCRQAETSDSLLIPFGVGPHAWLHRSCAEPWRESRREAAIAALAALKIEAP
jgi:hypothetical protein